MALRPRRTVPPLPDRRPDEYRVAVTEHCRAGVWGWRVQVYDLNVNLPDGAPTLTESRLGHRRMVGLWRSTHAGALHVGISEAHELHAAKASRTLVIWTDGVRVVDELRASWDGEGAPGDTAYAHRVVEGEVVCCGSRLP